MYTSHFYYCSLFSWPTFYPLHPEALQAAVWAPSGNALAVVKQNNIFYMRSINHKMEEVTNTGVVGEIYHGVADWLYRGMVTNYNTRSFYFFSEKILKKTECLWFSPDGAYLVFLTLNDTQVRCSLVTYPNLVVPVGA